MFAKLCNFCAKITLVVSLDIFIHSSDEFDDEASSRDYDRADGTDSTEEANERTSLLPPSGISTGEYREAKPVYTDNSRGRDRKGRSSDAYGERGRTSVHRRETVKRGNTNRPRQNDALMREYGDNDPRMFDSARRDIAQMVDTARRDNTRHGESIKVRCSLDRIISCHGVLVF
jgi:hypothetical protein